MAQTQTPKVSPPAEGRNYQLIFWSGALATIGGQLVNPTLVLPFLYLALGAPTFFAGLLLPFVTGSRLIAEIFMSPFINRATRAKLAVYVPNILTGAVLAMVALFATDLPNVMIVLLFLTTAVVMGLCQGITSLGTSQIYGISIPDAKRNRMVFAQATISGILAIIVVWITKDLLVSDQPMQRHIVVMWCGVTAMFAAGISFAGVRIFEEERLHPAPKVKNRSQWPSLSPASKQAWPTDGIANSCSRACCLSRLNLPCPSTRSTQQLSTWARNTRSAIL